MTYSSKKYRVSREVLKYPYCGTCIESKEFLSEKICSYTIKVRQKIIKKAKLIMISVDFIFRSTTAIASVTNGVVPSQAIGLPIVTTHPPIMRFINSNTHLSKNLLSAPILETRTDKIVFSEEQMDKLYEIALKCKNNSMTSEEILVELRGGNIPDIIEALLVIMGLVFLNMEGVEAFQIPLPPGAIPPPHLAWLYETTNQKPFGYDSSPSATMIGATRNAGSEKEDPSKGSLDYVEIMRKLDGQSQSKRKKIEITIGSEIYILKKTHPSDTAEELSSELADQMYGSIRACDSDVSAIARNLNFKAENVEKLKEYVFINKHYLYDDYGPDKIEYKRFDASLQQALAWKRLETGTHTQDDITWVKHECVEQFVKSRSNLPHSKAHQIAQRHFNGAPWDNNY